MHPISGVEDINYPLTPPLLISHPSPDAMDQVSTDHKYSYLNSEDNESNMQHIPLGRSKGSGQDYKYQTLSKVRTFEVEGQVITTITSHIVEVKRAGSALGRYEVTDQRKLQALRKQQAREIKFLQREELKESEVLVNHIKQEREVKDMQQNQEKMELERRLTNY